MNKYFSQETINYTSYINLQIKDFFIKKNTGVVFGQNIISGSRISGLGNGLDKLDNIKSINSTNSENALMGLGLGLALGGVPAIFLMKQHDFAILGLDQLTNTVNLISN
jgi:pyruvate/2-oxoglutarate/acetoin dehydrogenase E1 component